jgi:hypothetical protein
MEIVLGIHSIVRRLIVLVAVVAIVKFAIGWRRRSIFAGMDRGLISGFTGLIDLEVLLGFIYFFWNGLASGAGFPSFRIEHMITMLIAAVVAHLSALWKKSEDKLRFRNSLIIVLDTLIIILFGIARLPGGLAR